MSILLYSNAVIWYYWKHFIIYVLVFVVRHIVLNHGKIPSLMCFRNGLLQSLCPPETSYDPEISTKYSSKFDSWSLGIMMIELLTGSYLTKKLPKYVESWGLQVYPVIFTILKVSKFFNHLQSNPLHEILDKELSCLIRCIKIFFDEYTDPPIFNHRCTGWFLNKYIILMHIKQTWWKAH